MTTKCINLTEFAALGFLQEVNRRVLHPCGLALEFTVEDSGEVSAVRVQDWRDDPEGVVFAPGVASMDRRHYVDMEMEKRRAVREETIGRMIQSSRD